MLDYVVRSSVTPAAARTANPLRVAATPVETDVEHPNFIKKYSGKKVRLSFPFLFDAFVDDAYDTVLQGFYVYENMGRRGVRRTNSPRFHHGENGTSSKLRDSRLIPSSLLYLYHFITPSTPHIHLIITSNFASPKSQKSTFSPLRLPSILPTALLLFLIYLSLHITRTIPFPLLIFSQKTSFDFYFRSFLILSSNSLGISFSL